ncbi:hypothetical protein EI94DRAFT_1697529 [Lactarius quietus]|nr:hypothetical protein EI94DRAFT_1697529 [Lactarius quietus]
MAVTCSFRNQWDKGKTSPKRPSAMPVVYKLTNLCDLGLFGLSTIRLEKLGCDSTKTSHYLRLNLHLVGTSSFGQDSNCPAAWHRGDGNGHNWGVQYQDGATNGIRPQRPSRMIVTVRTCSLWDSAQLQCGAAISTHSQASQTISRRFVNVVVGFNSDYMCSELRPVGSGYDDGPFVVLANLEGVERGVMNYEKVPSNLTGLSPGLRGPLNGVSAQNSQQLPSAPLARDQIGNRYFLCNLVLRVLQAWRKPRGVCVATGTEIVRRHGSTGQTCQASSRT